MLIGTNETHHDQGVLTPVRIRELLQRLGPTFIKVGQFLAIRPDLIPQEYCDELLKLTDSVPGFDWSSVRQTIAEDLHQDPDELFDYVNPSPVAAASLAQVHLARTKLGEEVAIKVQRPNIHAQVEKDLRRAKWIVRILKATGGEFIADPKEVLEEVRGWLMQELDLRRELVNLTRLYQLSADNEAVQIPRPYHELSGTRVVTTEFLRGVPFSELLRLTQAGQREKIFDLGFDPDVLATNLILAVLTQIFRYRFFHADTHPGNLLALQDNRVGFVDFGLADVLNETLRRGQTTFIGAIYSGNIERIFRGLADMLIPGPRADLDGFRRDFLAATRDWLRSRAEGGNVTPEGESSIARYLIEALRTARSNDLRLPPEVLSMYRTLLTTETIAHHLGSQANLISVGRNFFIRLQVDTTIEGLRTEQMQAFGAELLTLVRESPGNLQRILSDLADEKFLLRVRTDESPADKKDANQRAQLLATTILCVSVSILLVGAPQVTLPFGLTLRILLSGSMFFLLLVFLILWRRIR